MIILSIHMNVAPEKHKEFSQTIVSLVESIRCLRGCLRCYVYYSAEDSNHTCLYEEWESWKKLTGHLQSELFKVLIGATILLKGSSEVRLYKAEPSSQTLAVQTYFER